MNYFFDFDEKLPECAMDRCGLYADDQCGIGINDGDWPGLSLLKYTKNHITLFGVKAKESIEAGFNYPNIWYCCTTTAG